MADFKLRAPPRLRFYGALDIGGVIGPGGIVDLAGAATGRAQAVANLLRQLNLASNASASAQATAALLKGIRLSGAATAGASSIAALDPPPPSFSVNPWRLVTVPNSNNPFAGPADGVQYGGAKHVYWGWHPLKKRIYTFGGDFGGNPNVMAPDGIDPPNGGQSIATNDPVSPRTYAAHGSFRPDTYSIDPFQSTSVWRLETRYMPRNIGGNPEAKPGAVDQASLVWDETRNKFWAIQTSVRDPYVHYLADGTTPDPWAGKLNTSPIEPAGTFSFVPGANGYPGTWAFESTARVAARYEGPTHYDGNVLISALAQERVAYWVRDSANDRVYGSGAGAIFIFNPATVTYEYRLFSPSDWGYWGASSSQLAIAGDYVYGTAYGRHTSYADRKSVLWRVKISAMLALADGGTITQYDIWTLPWSLSPMSPASFTNSGGQTYSHPSGVWEGLDIGDTWSEKSGVVAIEGKIIVCNSYENVVNGSVTKITAFAPSNQQFYASDAAPEAISAESWEAIPDSSEIFFGLNAAFGYPNGKLWAYRPTHLGPLALDSYNSNEGSGLQPTTYMFWQSGFRTRDGTLIEWGVSDHGHGNDNRAREYNPTTQTSAYSIPSPQVYGYPIKALNPGGSDYPNGGIPVTQHDNYMYFYVARLDSLVIPARGQFRRTQKDWPLAFRAEAISPSVANTSGPAQFSSGLPDDTGQLGWKNGVPVVSTISGAVMRPLGALAADQGSIDNFTGDFNPHAAWSDDYDCGFRAGGSPSGGSGGIRQLVWIIAPSAPFGSYSQPYVVFQKPTTTISGADPALAAGRDGCCFLGEYVYWVGGVSVSGNERTFFRMKITPHLSDVSMNLSLTSGPGAIERLADVPTPGNSGFRFGLLRADKWLNALLLVCSEGIYAYDVTYGAWQALSVGYAAEWPSSLMPEGCLGDFIDSHSGVSYRKFYWRAGLNYGWGSTPATVARYRSIKLKRS